MKRERHYLQPGDILYIPEKPYKLIREMAKLALRAFVQSFASDAGLFYVEERIFTDDKLFSILLISR